MASNLEAGTGVSYESLDPFKRACQRRAIQTNHNLTKRRRRINVIEWSRGESAFLFEDTNNQIWAHVHEGLGTKNRVADAYDFNCYRNIAYCTVATGVHDALTLGAMPVSVTMHLAVGDEDWLKDTTRAEALVEGWGDACDEAGCFWAGGETPQLSGIVVPGTAELSCSVVGLVESQRFLMSPHDIRAGDKIFFLGSSGIHANGLTKARQVADMLSDKYETKLSDGRTYGEALLTPTAYYVEFLRQCQSQGLIPHYGINISGHGLRKLARANRPFRYVVDILPRPQEEFVLIQKTLGLDDRQMYAAFNMGIGFAFYVDVSHVSQMIAIARSLNLIAWEAGLVEAAEESSVVLSEKNIEYGPETLQIR